MPVQCAAKNCRNMPGIESKQRNITFHRFPKELGLRTMWGEAVGRFNKDGSLRISKWGSLCSLHFAAEDFDKTGHTTRLRLGSVPSIFDLSAVKRESREDLMSGIQLLVEQNLSGKKLAAKKVRDLMLTMELKALSDVGGVMVPVTVSVLNVTALTVKCNKCTQHFKHHLTISNHFCCGQKAVISENLKLTQNVIRKTKRLANEVNPKQLPVFDHHDIKDKETSVISDSLKSSQIFPLKNPMTLISADNQNEISVLNKEKDKSVALDSLKSPQIIPCKKAKTSFSAANQNEISMLKKEKKEKSVTLDSLKSPQVVPCKKKNTLISETNPNIMSLFKNDKITDKEKDKTLTLDSLKSPQIVPCKKTLISAANENEMSVLNKEKDKSATFENLLSRQIVTRNTRRLISEMKPKEVSVLDTRKVTDGERFSFALGLKSKKTGTQKAIAARETVFLSLKDRVCVDKDAMAASPTASRQTPIAAEKTHLVPLRALITVDKAVSITPSQESACTTFKSNSVFSGEVDNKIRESASGKSEEVVSSGEATNIVENCPIPNIAQKNDSEQVSSISDQGLDCVEKPKAQPNSNEETPGPGITNGVKDKDFCIECYLKLEHNCVKRAENRLLSRICKVCKRQFRAIHEMKAHMRAHTDERPFLCDKCPKRFRRNISLKEHRLIHDGVKKHKCSFCDKAFVRRHQKQSHESIHQKKLYLCSVCGETFKDLRTMRGHLRLHEAIETPLICVDCHTEFSSKDRLRLHTCSAGKKHICFVCAKVFDTPWGTNGHMHIHLKANPQVCVACMVTFPNDIDYQNHLDENMVKCSVCDQFIPESMKCAGETHDNPTKCWECLTEQTGNVSASDSLLPSVTTLSPSHNLLTSVVPLSDSSAENMLLSDSALENILTREDHRTLSDNSSVTILDITPRQSLENLDQISLNMTVPDVEILAGRVTTDHAYGLQSDYLQSINEMFAFNQAADLETSNTYSQLGSSCSQNLETISESQLKDLGL